MLIEVDAEAPVMLVAEAPKEMLSASYLPDGRTKVRVNFSSLSLMQECWRKAEYSLVRGLRSNLESPATLFGSAIHKALEVFYSGHTRERKIPPAYEDTLKQISFGQWLPEWEAELLFRSARAFVTKAEPLAAFPPDNKRSIQAGVWILSHYFRTYVTDPFVVMTDADGPITERKFSMPVHEDDETVIEGFGQIDVVLRNEQTGVILPADHKTTSQFGAQFYQRLKPNHQYTFYSWAANQVLGLNTDAFLVNALQVKDVPKTVRGSAPQFARQVTTRDEGDYDELKQALVYNVREFLKHRQAGHFPQTAPSPCSNYGGCQYLDTCAAPAQLRENIIRAKFTQGGHIAAK